MSKVKCSEYEFLVKHERCYHITKRIHLHSISKEGLVPVALRTASEKPAVYYTPIKESIPDWKAIFFEDMSYDELVILSFDSSVLENKRTGSGGDNNRWVWDTIPPEAISILQIKDSTNKTIPFQRLEELLGSDFLKKDILLDNKYKVVERKLSELNIELTQMTQEQRNEMLKVLKSLFEQRWLHWIKGFMLKEKIRNNESGGISISGQHYGGFDCLGKVIYGIDKEYPERSVSLKRDDYWRDIIKRIESDAVQIFRVLHDAGYLGEKQTTAKERNAIFNALKELEIIRTSRWAEPITKLCTYNRKRAEFDLPKGEVAYFEKTFTTENSALVQSQKQNTDNEVEEIIRLVDSVLKKIKNKSRAQDTQKV